MESRTNPIGIYTLFMRDRIESGRIESMGIDSDVQLVHPSSVYRAMRRTLETVRDFIENGVDIETLDRVVKDGIEYIDKRLSELV